MSEGWLWYFAILGTALLLVEVANLYIRAVIAWYRRINQVMLDDPGRAILMYDFKPLWLRAFERVTGNRD